MSVNPDLSNLYRERAILLAVLSTHYPAHLSPATDAEPGFEQVVCLHIDGKQHAWHVADQDRILYFDHLDTAPGHYDGHSTEEKLHNLMVHLFHTTRWTRRRRDKSGEPAFDPGDHRLNR